MAHLIKNVALKNKLFRIYDILFCWLTLIGAIQLRVLRRYGITNFPLGHRILLKIGVFPLHRHYYEPLFHPGDLRRPLDTPRQLPGIDFAADRQQALLKQFHYNGEIIHYFGGEKPACLGGSVFTTINRAFHPGDIDLYYNIIRHFKPSRIIEIGSGVSTMVALQAMLENEKEEPGRRCSITAIEPYPWFYHDRLEVIPKFVEDVDMTMFTDLRANDILFIDSSHMIRPHGDVLFEILDILPRLAPGVIVHVHDVFTPREYPGDWIFGVHNFWNEQYLVESFLSCNDRFAILVAPNYLQMHHGKILHECCPLLALHPENPVHSIWFQRKIEPPGGA